METSPWGKVQCEETYEIDGIKTKARVRWVSTPGHGGYLVPLKIAKLMPQHYRNIGYKWGNYLAFEEDCAWSAVELSFPEITAMRWDVVTGKRTLEECVIEAQKCFERWYDNA